MNQRFAQVTEFRAALGESRSRCQSRVLCPGVSSGDTGLAAPPSSLLAELGAPRLSGHCRWLLPRLFPKSPECFCEGAGGGRRPGCVSSESLMPWRPKKDTRRTPFHANWHCLQATKDSLYQFHPVACRERLRGDLPAWLWGSPNSQLLLLPQHGGGKTNPKRGKKKNPKPKQNPRLLLHMLPGKQTSLFLPLPHVLPFRFCFTCKQTW